MRTLIFAAAVVSISSGVMAGTNDEFYIRSDYGRISDATFIKAKAACADPESYAAEDRCLSKFGVKHVFISSTSGTLRSGVTQRRLPFSGKIRGCNLGGPQFDTPLANCFIFEAGMHPHY